MCHDAKMTKLSYLLVNWCLQAMRYDSKAILTGGRLCDGVKILVYNSYVISNVLKKIDIPLIASKYGNSINSIEVRKQNLLTRAMGSLWYPSFQGKVLGLIPLKTCFGINGLYEVWPF